MLHYAIIISVHLTICYVIFAYLTMSHSYKDYKKLVQEIQVKLILKSYGRQTSLETRYVHELWAWEAPAGGVCFTHLLQVRLIDSTEKVQASESRKGKSYENSLTYRQVCAGFSSKIERLLEKRCVHDKCAACSHYWFSHNVCKYCPDFLKSPVCLNKQYVL